MTYCGITALCDESAQHRAVKTGCGQLYYEIMMLFVHIESECANESNQLCSDQYWDSDQLSSTCSSSTIDSVSSYNLNYCRHSFPLLNGDHESRHLSKSASDVLYTSNTENRTSGVEQSISSNCNDSGCNSCGSETLLDQTDNRTRPHSVLSAETTPDDARLPRKEDNSADDSGYHHTLLQPVDLDSASVRGSKNSESEPRHQVGDEDDLKKMADRYKLTVSEHNRHPTQLIATMTDGVDDVRRTVSGIHAAQSDSETFSPANVVQRRASSASKSQRNCASDADRVVTRRTRRTSMLVRPTPHDRAARTRRRHSFMLPNGSDIYPTRFSAGLAWPTIVEEDMQLTEAASDDVATKPVPTTSGGTQQHISDDTFADLLAFRGTLNSAQHLAEVDSSKLDRAVSLKDSGFTISDFHRDAADFLALGTKLKGSLQLADSAEFGKVSSKRILEEREASSIFEEGTFVDRNALGWRATSRGVTPSPSPPTARRPPSYGEALLHKALRFTDRTEVDSLMTYEQDLTTAPSPVRRPPDAGHLLTSSTSGDVTVTAEVAAAGCRRPPPPPYQLRQRRQNCGEDGIRNPRNNGSVQGPEITGSDAGQRARKNKSEPAVARIDRNDRKSSNPDCRNNFPSPTRRRQADSAQKENACAITSPSVASPSSWSGPGAQTEFPAAGPSSPSPAESMGPARKTSRDSTLLRRRSLTIKDRDWHRELVDQYMGGATSCSVSVSTTACV